MTFDSVHLFAVFVISVGYQISIIAGHSLINPFSWVLIHNILFFISIMVSVDWKWIYFCTLKCIEETVFHQRVKGTKARQHLFISFCYLVYFSCQLGRKKSSFFYPNQLAKLLVFSMTAWKIRIYYYNFACVIYIDINNPRFIPFISLLLRRFYPLDSVILSTLHIYINKKRGTAIHNSIKLISIHQSGQQHIRICSSLRSAYIFVYICAVLSFDGTIPYVHIRKYSLFCSHTEKPQMFPNILSCIS